MWLPHSFHQKILTKQFCNGVIACSIFSTESIFKFKSIPKFFSDLIIKHEKKEVYGSDVTRNNSLDYSKVKLRDTRSSLLVQSYRQQYYRSTAVLISKRHKVVLKPPEAIPNAAEDDDGISSAALNTTFLYLPLQ